MDKLKIAGIVIFCAMLAAGAGISCILPQKEYSERENRTLERKPDFSWEDVRNGEYQEHYEAYLNDQMFLRDEWVKLAAELERLLGKREVNGVYLGKDGYLLEKYDVSAMDPVQIEENIHDLASFLNIAVKRYGKERVICMMLPSKADAIPDKLPDYAGGNEANDTIAKIAQQLAEKDSLLDVSKELQNHQEEYIFYRTDHHWTTLGAYYAYCAWADKTGHCAEKLEEYDREIVFEDFYGTTYNKVHIRVPMDRVELFHSPSENGVQVVEDDGEVVSDSFYFRDEAAEGFDRYRVFFSKNTAKIHVSTKAETGRSLLVIKDSFANCFVPFLAGDYENIIMIDCRYSKENIYRVLEENDEITDVLVMFNTEKFMQDTNLHLLDEQSGTMEEFNMEDFFDEME